MIDLGELGLRHVISLSRDRHIYSDLFFQFVSFYQIYYTIYFTRACLLRHHILPSPLGLRRWYMLILTLCPLAANPLFFQMD